VACGYGSADAPRCSSRSAAARSEVALEVRFADGVPLVCLEEDLLVRGFFAAGSGVLLLGTSSSGIISLLLGWLLEMLYEML